MHTLRISRLRSSLSSTFKVIFLPSGEIAAPDLTSLSRYPHLSQLTDMMRISLKYGMLTFLTKVSDLWPQLEQTPGKT